LGYSKQVYNKAWQTLENRGAEARARAAARREEVLKRIPRITGIQQEMAAGAAGITRAVINAPARAGDLIEKLAEQNLSLQQQRSALLLENGFPPDYLEEQFGCPHCRDKGYVGTGMCICLRELLASAAYAELSAAAPVRSCSFDTFSLDYYPDAPGPDGKSPRGRMRDILTVCRSYAASFSPGSESLLLIGQTGLGKTHLSLAIAEAVIGAGFGVVYTPVQRLLDTLESEKFSYDTQLKEQYAEHLRSAITCDLLVLDDLGTEFITQYSNSVLYSIINSRQVEGRPTIISTNLELAEIESKYAQRMLSRLVCAYKVLKFTGKDIRFIKKTQPRGSAPEEITAWK